MYDQPYYHYMGLIIPQLFFYEDAFSIEEWKNVNAIYTKKLNKEKNGKIGKNTKLCQRKETFLEYKC